MTILPSDKGVPRGRRREVRQEQLLEAAARLFAHQGLEGTTTKDIARAAGVSPSLLYHYYPSKQDLLVAVVAYFDPTSRVRSLVEGDLGGSIGEALLRILRGIAEFLEERRDMLWLCMRAASRFPEVAQALKDTKMQLTELMAGFLQARVASGELRPHDSHRVAAGLYHTIAMEHMVGSPSRSDMDSLVETFLYGLVPRSGPWERSRQAGPGGD